MTARRWLPSALAVASLSLALPLASAGAKVPTGGCPATFVGPLTFQRIIDTWPTPPKPLNNGTIEANDNVVRTR